MNTRTRLAILCCSLLLASGCRRNTASSAEGDQQPAERRHAAGLVVVRLSAGALARANLETARVEPGRLEALVLAPAVLEIDAEHTASVGPRVTGRISTVTARVGERVRAGSVLATIDSTEVASAQADEAAARSAEDVARRNYERERSLLERRISPQRDVLAAEAELARATAQRQMAEARLHSLGLSGGEGAAGSRLALTAPMAGTVVERSAVVGAPVSPTDVLFRIADLRSLWLVASVAETQLRQVRRGQTVRMTLDAVPDTEVEGRVSYVAETVRPDTRTVDVRVVVPNPDGRLKPGMFARARIETEAAATASPSDATMTIPSMAVQRIEGSPVVFVQTGDREFTARSVAVGEILGDRVIVVDGLRPGEVIVTRGSFILKAEAVRGQATEEQ